MECPYEGCTDGLIQITVPIRAITTCPICGGEGALWIGGRYEVADEGETAVVRIAE